MRIENLGTTSSNSAADFRAADVDRNSAPKGVGLFPAGTNSRMASKDLRSDYVESGYH